jgi:hypothetical protein
MSDGKRRSSAKRLCRCAQPHDPWCPSGPRRDYHGYWKALFDRGMWRCDECREELPLGRFLIRKAGPRAGKPPSARCREHAYAHGADKKAHYNFGIDYWKILESQSGRCAMCGTEENGGSRFAVDHDHGCCPGKTSCGECVRGLLCTQCNVGIAMFGDDVGRLEAGIRYINAWRELPKRLS